MNKYLASAATVRIGLGFFVVFWASSAGSPAQEPPRPTVEAQIKRLQQLDDVIDRQIEAGTLEGAIEPSREKLEIMVRLKGAADWQTVTIRQDLETVKRLATRPREIQLQYAQNRQNAVRAVQLAKQGQWDQAIALHRTILDFNREQLGEEHPDTGACYHVLGRFLEGQGKASETEAVYRRALEIRLKALGAGHPDTAMSESTLAEFLRNIGQYPEAEALHRRALATRINTVGPKYPETARSYNNLALTLDDIGKHAEAEGMFRKALAIQQANVGEKHMLTARMYSSLASNLDSQGKFAEAEIIHRRVLATMLQLVGEAHPETAISCNNLAMNLIHQSRLPEAEIMARRSLKIDLQTNVGESRKTAITYSNLATILRREGKDPEAEPILRRTLAIMLKVMGPEHDDTARAYTNLASTLSTLGKIDEAEALERRALEINLKSFGEDHPATALCLANLAATLNNRKKYDEAEIMDRRSLGICLNVLGEDHPSTANGYNNLATTLEHQKKYPDAEVFRRKCLSKYLLAADDSLPELAMAYSSLATNLELQGKDAEAARNWALAVPCYERARLRGVAGYEASLTSGSTPFPNFALSLARSGRFTDAWTNWEQGLARGLLDEVSGRAARPLTAEERDREARLLGESQVVAEGISKLSSQPRTQEQDRALDDLKNRESTLRSQRLDLEKQFQDRYGVLAGKPVTLRQTQEALPEGTALVGWIDAHPHHGVCLVKRVGEPIWVEIAGSDKDGIWSAEEESLVDRLRAELNPETTRGNFRPLAEALARQRLDPLKPHLAGIKRLVVVNSPGLAGVPLEVLQAVRADPTRDGLTLSYAPSASMYVHLTGTPTARNRPASLFALADPAYPQPQNDAAPPPPPDSGLGVARVMPNGNADLNGIREGDILLTYAGKALTKLENFKAATPTADRKTIVAACWRDGTTREIQLAAGPLGAVFDNRPAPEFVRAWRESRRLMLGLRGGSYPRLPGTRREAEAIGRFFAADSVKLVTGAEACESTVQELARSGKLKQFRYLHFATHGESDPRNAYRSALILAPDPESTADSSALDADGRITAEQIARTWDLDADLIVLSACESALGRAGGGEGALGFAQPLFARGAHSIVLSLWKVDDDATALLMARFYANLLGKRGGLKAPLPKAEALAEAKGWLRAASVEEVGKTLETLPRGDIVRREVAASKPKTCPYEDPIYWAAFILVGSPD